MIDDDDDPALVDSRETEGGSLTFDLQGFPDHDEVIVIECDGDEDDEQIVALALNVAELDEVRRILDEVRAMMVARHRARLPAPPRIRVIRER